MNKILAEENDCIVCGNKADVFWPVVDPEIQAQPYCNKCLKLEQDKILDILCKFNNKERKK